MGGIIPAEIDLFIRYTLFIQPDNVKIVLYKKAEIKRTESVLL